jgi:hypothetical protein
MRGTLALVYKVMNIKEVLTMSDLDKQTQFSDSTIIRTWQRIPVLIRALVSGAFVTAVGVEAWLLCLAVIPAPWSIAVMGGILWLFWKYFSGSWWPRATVEARRNNFRAVKLSAAVWKWGLVGAFLVHYIVMGIAGMLVALAMLRTDVFSRTTALAGLTQGAMMLVPVTFGTIGLLFALGSLVPFIIWFVLIALRLFRMSAGDNNVVALPI